MRNIIFAINITVDGFADHTAGIADDELHKFFADYLADVGVVLLGRKTYEMMASYWPHANENPGSTKSEIEFADRYNSIEKVVFSKTLNSVDWNNTTLNNGNLIDEVLRMKKQNGKYISVGSLSLASQLTKKGLIDEYWFLVHPVILGKGKHLLEGNHFSVNLKLLDSEIFKSGVVALHYKNVLGFQRNQNKNI